MYTVRDTSTDTAGSAPQSLAAQVYGMLKRRLLVGDYALGRRLAENSLAGELDVSRTPIRDALSRLHVEGLVVRLPEGGYTPAAPDLHTVSELYEVRRGLELSALHRTRGHDLKGLQFVRDEWLAMEAPESDEACGPDFVLHDEEFHVGLAQASGNQSLSDLLVTVNERIRFVRMQDFLTADRVIETIKEHLSIVEALIDGDVGLADRRLTGHLHMSEQVVEQRAAIALARMVGGRSRG